MPSLAELPELVGFFSYSREDDADSHGRLSALRTLIQGELRGQLGRTAKTFRLWQDKEAIASGTLWESEIKNAVGQSVFFIPIITPTVVRSPYCKFELESFLEREVALGRADLVFPIVYIDVPELEDDARQNDPVLSLIARRQYRDWRDFRYLDVNSPEVRREVGTFCTDIRNALRRSWMSPEEREREQEAVALRQAEEDRQRQEAEAKRRAEEGALQRAADEQRRKREAEAERTRIAAAEAKAREDEQRRQRDEAKAKRRAQAEEQRRLQQSQARPLWPPSRGVLVVGALIGVALLAAIGAWGIYWPVCCAPPPTPAPAVSLAPDQERALKPKDTFKECANCPQMPGAPVGSFTMGSPASEPGRYSDEGPQHTVTIARQYAVGQFALTFDQWDACVADGDCNGYRPSDHGWGRGQRPVIDVSWDDAKAYVAWLAKKTGKPYRLLTEAEYEYAARAGTTTAYPWGSAIGTNNANCADCGSQWDNKQTAPVGSFAANGFGLYDMVGNVRAWTEDCYHNNYNGAPIDGSAWTTGNCRVVRGGSWFNNSFGLRSANRSWTSVDTRTGNLGFRVGRTLLAP